MSINRQRATRGWPSRESFHWIISGRGGANGTGDTDDPDLRNRDLFRDTGLGEGGRGAFEHTGGENESRHLHNRGDRYFVLRSFEPFDWEKTVIHLLAPIALVSYAVAAIVGSCFAILLTATWRVLDILVTRAAIRARNRRSRVRTLIRLNSENRIY
jgi:hypothetical protein